MYQQRVIKEANAADKMHESNFYLFVNKNNIQQWSAFILGPDDSPFRAGIFELKITLSVEYPIKPPNIRFLTQIFHPNIHFETGEICLEVLKDSWTPQWTLQSVIRAIQVLMASPNADSPFNCDAGNLVRNGDLMGYNSLAEMYTKEYAICKDDFKLDLLSLEMQFQQQEKTSKMTPTNTEMKKQK